MIVEPRTHSNNTFELLGKNNCPHIILILLQLKQNKTFSGKEKQIMCDSHSFSKEKIRDKF